VMPEHGHWQLWKIELTQLFVHDLKRFVLLRGDEHRLTCRRKVTGEICDRQTLAGTWRTLHSDQARCRILDKDGYAALCSIRGKWVVNNSSIEILEGDVYVRRVPSPSKQTS